MRKSIKIVFTVLAILAIVLVSTSVLATDKPSDVVNIDTSNTQSVTNIGNRIVGIIKVVGTIVSVAMLIVLGIKYMMGSAEEKAEYKKTLFPYFIGAILIFAATQLADIIYSWASGI